MQLHWNEGEYLLTAYPEIHDLSMDYAHTKVITDKKQRKQKTKPKYKKASTVACWRYEQLEPVREQAVSITICCFLVSTFWEKRKIHCPLSDQGEKERTPNTLGHTLYKCSGKKQQNLLNKFKAVFKSQITGKWYFCCSLHLLQNLLYFYQTCFSQSRL